MAFARPVYDPPQRKDCTFRHKELEFGEWHYTLCMWTSPATQETWRVMVEWLGFGPDKAQLENQAFCKLGILVDRDERAKAEMNEDDKARPIKEP